ncbi:uncharacterized protein LOC123010203 isoform X2 [Tribolium madens]|uniref:uncharacterized protein LOC123010203 isoform X2 n=1 Tax=Tribolium madens TaxID=41895 RepID=UPI001CF71FD9|nr:uncharacterized protein LOC123010203 isoform X2 [Tribolium madens]
MSGQVPARCNYINYDIYFGVVPVGTTVVKPYHIRNQYNEVVSYLVTRNTRISPIYHVFDANKYETKLDPGRELVLKISYSPNIPGTKNYDYFTVNDSRQNFYRLCLRGECSGPLVTTSIRNLNLLKTPKQKIVKQIFTLSNSSECCARFQFDCIRHEQGVFAVEPVEGVIQPQEHVYIEVRFSPQNHRFYSRQLACLILYHEPILINLFGIYSNTDYDLTQSPLRYYQLPYEETVSFAGYLSDSVTLKYVPPPVSFTVNYLDFGRMLPESSCQTLTTSFTNHMETQVEVEWEKTELFRIYPEKLEIPGKMSALYECRFHPSVKCRLSSAIINGFVTWTPTEEDNPLTINVPIPVSLRFIGHSFPGKQAWIPSISIIPNNVILPLCLPNLPSWTTFMIEAHGHLPVLFKLLPPRKTNFIMKPMVGLVRTFQIIVVQLESNSTEPTSYIEKWNIELNGRESSSPIYVKAQTDVPRLVVGYENCIKFEPMQPGTQTSIYVPLANVSSCHIQYEFLTSEYFGVVTPRGVLAPNEEIFLTCWYQSDLSQIGESNFSVNCRIQCMYKESVLIGEPVDVPVTVFVEVVYSELCAFPSVFKCGQIEYGKTITTCFHIFNFGYSNINFKLCHDHDLKDVVLYPAYGRCGSREKLLVNVQFTLNNLGKRSLHIGYTNRLNEFSENVINEGTKSIFRIEYDCICATLQITDLLEHNLGGLFSNSDLWCFLKIDEINAALKETNQGEISRVDLCVPDCEISQKLFYLVFVIKNVSNADMRVALKRRKVCDCEQKQSDESLTFRIKVYDCPHKDLFSLELTNPFMPANSAQRLILKIKHTLPDQNMLSYILEMTNERTIIFNILVNSIAPDSYVLSVYKLDYKLDLGFVYIGLREAPVLAFWLYNNTAEAVPYKLDDLEIVKLCNQDGFPVLKSLTSLGFIKARSRAPLLFKFWPIEVKCYKVIVPLMLGTQPATLQIEGYGTDQIKQCEFKDVANLAQKPLYNNVVSLSVDRLVVEPLLVASSTQRLFFIRNRDRNHRIQYRWKTCLIDGLVKMEALTNDGFLKPQEAQPVILKISSLNEPCSVEPLFSCEFVDYDQLLSYNESAKLLNERRRSSLKEFIISGETEENENKEIEDIELPPMPEFFNITLPVTINVIGYSDRDTCLSLESQMKQKPCDTIPIDVDQFLEEYFKATEEKERPIRPPIEKITQEECKIDEPLIAKELTKNVLEYLASDAVFCDYFREKIHIMKNEPNPLYSQIKLEEKAKQHETKKFFTQAKLSEIGEISKEAVTHSLEATFHVGPFARKTDS